MKSGKDGNCAGDPENTSNKKRATNREKKTELSLITENKQKKKKKRKRRIAVGITDDDEGSDNGDERNVDQ